MGHFPPLYEQTMRRADAAAFYFFPRRVLGALDRLGDWLLRFDASRRRTGRQRPVSRLAAVPALPPRRRSDRGRAARRHDAAALRIAHWAQHEGYARFHLGGGVGGGRDSLHGFKQRFDPGGECPMAIGKAVHDPDAYRALGGDPGDLAGFFPAYRRPAEET